MAEIGSEFEISHRRCSAAVRESAPISKKHKDALENKRVTAKRGDLGENDVSYLGAPAKSAEELKPKDLESASRPRFGKRPNDKVMVMTQRKVPGSTGDKEVRPERIVREVLVPIDETNVIYKEAVKI